MGKKNVEDLYPLSPMQQGMLFHSLYDPASGAYIEQMVCTLHGDLDIAAFQRAWQQVIDRHPVLRTAFVGEGLREPTQIVLWRTQPPLVRQDWRGLDPTEQAACLEAFLRADRARNFELSKAPLLRLALMQLAQDIFTFVWTYHHILLDGWSIPLLFREVFAFYEAFQRGEELHLELPRPYRDYIVWLRQRALADAEPFWRRTLQGFRAPTPLLTHLALGSAAGQQERHQALKIHLSTSLTATLAALAQQQHMTVNTLVQAAWGLLLSRYSAS